jgi:hypothetical protein
MLVASMVTMRSFQMELVHGVVSNTLIQKGPKNYSQRKVRETFRATRESAEREDRSQAYLEELFALSQRLEKIQELSKDEIDEILISLQR